MLVRKIETETTEGPVTSFQVGHYTPAWEWEALATFDTMDEALEFYGRMVGHIEAA